MSQPDRSAETVPPAPLMEDGTATVPPCAEAVDDPQATTPPTPGASRPTGGGLVPAGYEILGELGRGGMGVVYKARQVKAGRVVALKMILAGGHAGEAELARFRTEAEAIARLQHPGIVQVFEVGEHDGMPFFSLEFCPGGSLDRQLAGNPLLPRDAAALVEKLARAMQVAHDVGVIHRDLKPANVLLTEGERRGVSPPVETPPHRRADAAPLANVVPKITDFGLAKKLDEAGQTQTGAVMGTPSYMAPEQAEAKKTVGPPADIYALGAILYECLTGRPPFRAATTLDTILQVVSDEPVSVTQLNRQVPRDLETICLKCLRKEPGKRYATAAELAADLGRWQRDEPIVARPIGAMERGVKWVRRNLVVAGLTAAVALVLLLGAGISTYFALDARAQLRRAEGLVYAGQLQLAQAAWNENDFFLARQHLDTTRPVYRGWEYRHLYTRFTSNQRTFRGHTSLVSSVVFSPDGKRIVSGSGDYTVKVWDSATGKEVHTLKGHTGAVGSVAISPDGKRIVSGSKDNTLKLWDAVKGQKILTLEGHTGGVSSVAFSPDGQRIVSGSGDTTVRVWDAVKGQKILTLKGHTGPVRSVAFSPDGQRIVSGGGPVWNTHQQWKPPPGEVTVWDAVKGQKILTLEGHTREVSCVTYSPDGQRIVSGSDDYTVKVWDSATGKEVHTLKGHRSDLMSVAFSPDGQRLVSGSLESVTLWDAAIGQPLRNLQVHKLYVLSGLQRAATGRGVDLRNLQGHTLYVLSVAYSPDGQRLVSSSGNPFDPSQPGEVKVWELAKGQEVLTLKGHTHEVTSVAISPDGQRILSGSGGKDAQWKPLPGEVKVWDAATGQVVHTLKGHTGGVSSVAISPDGQRLVSGSSHLSRPEGEVRVWEATTGQELRTLKAASTSVAYSPDGQRLVSGVGQIVIEWNAATGQVVRTLQRHRGIVTSVAFSPDGKRLAAGSRGSGGDGRLGEVTVWDAATGQEIRTLKGHTGEVTSVAFSPDGKRLAAGSRGSDDFRTPGEVTVWDAATGREFLTLKGHTGEVSSVVFSPDGQRILSGSKDKTMKVWDAATGHEILTLKGHTGAVSSLAFSSDGQRLVSGSADGTVKVWNAADPPSIDR